ncbi:PhzF family phenazine biosynthesis protein, partial [Frankia sp. Cpl3]|nr:PhzF family phenazine biosynthesis protein [Frankia sp. Cpl3]
QEEPSLFQTMDRRAQKKPLGVEWSARDFGPAVGIPEDPVTGSANGALSGYLILEEILPAGQLHRLKIGQGDAIGRAGILYVTIVPGEAAPIIQVAGTANVTIAGKLRLPE